MLSVRDPDVWADVKSCARCGGDHLRVPFGRLTHPFDDFDHWGVCPTLGQPISMKIVKPGAGKAAEEKDDPVGGR